MIRVKFLRQHQTIREGVETDLEIGVAYELEQRGIIAPLSAFKDRFETFKKSVQAVPEGILTQREKMQRAHEKRCSDGGRIGMVYEGKSLLEKRVYSTIPHLQTGV